jgi:FkbM family methyltransferase
MGDLKVINNATVLNRVAIGAKGLFEPTVVYNKQWRSSSGYQSHMLTRNFLETISNHIDLGTIKTILDIGSRDALQSIEFKMWFPDADVYAFEANTDCVTLCRRTMETYKDHVINLVPKAVTDYNGVIEFHNVHNGNIGGSSILETTNHQRSCQWKQNKIEVPCIRVDDWVNENNIETIDLLWIDVQGVELQVLKSIGENIRNVKAIQTEVGLVELYKNQTTHVDLDAYLVEYGFECIKQMPTTCKTEMDVIYVNKKFMI